MRNIVLTGFMGTGKSAVAQELARLTGMRLIDIDSEIERAEGMSIAGIFEDRGEPAFREIERETIRRMAQTHGAVISTGGGAVMREENIEALRANGQIVCLIAAPETIYRRTCTSGHRPLLNAPDPLEKIKELLEIRKPYYERADVVIHTDDNSPLEVAQEILRRLAWKH